MKLTEHHKNILHSKIRLTHCNSCGLSSISFSDTIYEMREFNGGRLNLSSSLYPVIVASCSNCGNTVFYNAIILGLVNQKGELIK